MKIKSITLFLLIIAALFFTSCDGDAGGGGDATAVTLTVTTSANGNPVGGVTLSYNGTEVTTAADGTYSLTVSPDASTGTLPATISIAYSKKFFVSGTASFQTADYAGQTAVSEVLEIAPRIFIDDMMGNGGIGRIVAVDDMSGTNRVDLSEIPGYAAEDVESSENTGYQGFLDAPTAITVDYENGVIYVFDCESTGNQAYASNDAVLIVLTDFPETSADTISESDVTIIPLQFGGGAVARASSNINAVHQAAVTGTDELLILCGTEYSESEIYRLSNISSGTPFVEPAAAMSSGLPGSMAAGLAESEGKIYLLTDTKYSSEGLYVLDGFDDTAEEELVSLSSEFDLAQRLLVDKSGRWLYAGDCDLSNPYTTDRIVRFDLDSADALLDLEGYGSSGSGTAQFDEPILLAILPDNRLYIKDVANSRLVRVDWSGDSAASAWAAWKPEDDAGTADVNEAFDFSYFYNPC